MSNVAVIEPADVVAALRSAGLAPGGAVGLAPVRDTADGIGLAVGDRAFAVRATAPITC